MDRIPVRIRLVLAFIAVVAMLLAGSGFALRALYARSLDRAIDDGLRARAADVATLVTDELSGDGAGLRPSVLTDRGERFAQVLDSRGTLVADTPQTTGYPLLDGPQRTRALRGGLWATLPAGRGARWALRLRAIPVPTPDGRLAVVVGTPLRERDQAIHQLMSLLLIGEPLILVLMSIVGYLVAAGALRPVEAIRARAARLPGEENGGLLPVPRARDEISRLATTLNEMLSRIERLAQRERRFVADASHELRTPLAVLKGELEIARMADRTDDERGEAVASAAEEVERLGQLVDDLLLVAASDERRLPLRPARIDAAAQVRRVADRARRRVDLAGRDLAVEAEPGIGLDADPERLVQLLDGLVDNAIRHGDGPIEISARREGGVVEFGVHDHGAGFPETFLPLAFERLSRGDHARTQPGAGLGLAIVRLIAEAHGGCAGARNEGGAYVWARFPLASAERGPGQDPVAGGTTSTVSLSAN